MILLTCALPLQNGVYVQNVRLFGDVCGGGAAGVVNAYHECVFLYTGDVLIVYLVAAMRCCETFQMVPVHDI